MLARWSMELWAMVLLALVSFCCGANNCKTNPSCMATNSVMETHSNAAMGNSVTLEASNIGAGTTSFPSSFREINQFEVTMSADSGTPTMCTWSVRLQGAASPQAGDDIVTASDPGCVGVPADSNHYSAVYSIVATLTGITCPVAPCDVTMTLSATACEDQLDPVFDDPPLTAAMRLSFPFAAVADQPYTCSPSTSYLFPGPAAPTATDDCYDVYYESQGVSHESLISGDWETSSIHNGPPDQAPPMSPSFTNCRFKKQFRAIEDQNTASFSSPYSEKYDQIEPLIWYEYYDATPPTFSISESSYATACDNTLTTLQNRILDQVQNDISLSDDCFRTEFAPLRFTTGQWGEKQVKFSWHNPPGAEICAGVRQERTLTLYAHDICGNVSPSINVSVSFADNIPPTWESPAALNHMCGSGPVPEMPPTVSDSCGLGTIAKTNYSDVSMGCVGTDVTIHRTWHAWDECGNQGDSSPQVITIETGSPPTISGAISHTIECGDSLPAFNPMATDDCLGDITSDIVYVRTMDPVGALQCGGQVGVFETELTVSDQCQSDTHTYTLTVQDTQDPTFTGMAMETIQCMASTDPMFISIPAASDACDDSLPAPSHMDMAPTTFGGCGLITFDREWSVTDCAGRIGTFTQTITEVDSTPPTWTLQPPGLLLECSASTHPSDTGTAEATDECLGRPGQMPPAVTYVDLPITGTCRDNVTRSWTAMDCSGNSVSYQQLLRIVDTIPPTWTSTPDADIEVYCTDDTSESALGTPEAFDACDGTLTVSSSDMLQSTTCGLSTWIRTFSAQDCEGFLIMFEQTIRQVDGQPPVLDPIAPSPVGCNEPTDPTHTGVPIVNDDCSAPSPPVYTEDVTYPGACQLPYYTRNWTSTDCEGNVGFTVQRIATIYDEDPVVTAPPHAIIECGSPFDPSVTGEGSVVDPCTSAPPSYLFHTDNVIAVGVCGESTVNRTWTARRCDGVDFSAPPQEISLVDTLPPQFITIPPDVTIECTESTDPSSTGTAVARDACGEPVTVTSSDVVSTDPSCGAPLGEIQRMWVATDCQGLQSTAIQVITIVDTTAPTFTPPEHFVRTCQVVNPLMPPTITSLTSAITGSPTNVTDACGGAVTTTQVDSTPTGPCLHTVTLRRTWELEDCSGNSARFVQTISLFDNDAPNFKGMLDMMGNYPSFSVECGDGIEPAGGSPPIVTTHGTVYQHGGSGPPGSEPPVFSDTCDTSVVVSYADTFTPSCGGAGLVTRLWRATDDCGNSEILTQKIEIDDKTDPFLQRPENMSFECSTASFVPSPQELAFGDVCDIHMDAPEYEDAVVFTQCGGMREITRTHTATDGCGNSVSYSNTLFEVDTTSPTVEAPEDFTIECLVDPVLDLTGHPQYTDSCWAHSAHDKLMLTINDTELLLCGQTKQIFRTFTATDPCGNVASDVQVITVADNVSPSLEVPESAILECVRGYDWSSDPSLGDATAYDACNSPGSETILVDVRIDTGFQSCAREQHIRTFTATDECGNIATGQQEVLLVDTLPPSVSVDDVTMECGGPIADSLEELLEAVHSNHPPVADDQCATADELLVSYVYHLSDLESLGDDVICSYELEKEWTVIDCAQNVATTIQSVRFVDSTPPVWTYTPESLQAECTEFTPTLVATSAELVDGDVPVAEDLCQTVLEVLFEDLVPSEDLDGAHLMCKPEDRSFERRWTARDACGNEAVFVQEIFVQRFEIVSGEEVDHSEQEPEPEPEPQPTPRATPPPTTISACDGLDAMQMQSCMVDTQIIPIEGGEEIEVTSMGEVIGTVTLPNGAAPPGSSLVIQGAVNTEEEQRYFASAAFDLTIVDLNGAEIQPKEDVELCIEVDSSVSENDHCIGFKPADGSAPRCEDPCPERFGHRLCGTVKHFTTFGVLLGAAPGGGSNCGGNPYITNSYGGDLALVSSCIGLFVLLALLAIAGSRNERVKRVLLGDEGYRIYTARAVPLGGDV